MSTYFLWQNLQKGKKSHGAHGYYVGKCGTWEFRLNIYFLGSYVS